MIRFDPYLTMAFMGLFAALATQLFNFTQAGYEKKTMVKILALSFLSVLAAVGFALAGYWQNMGILYSLPPSEWLEQIGFTAYHGLIGAFLTFFLGCKVLKLDICRTFSISIPATAIFMAFGRVGCSFAGCCYGKQADFTILGLHFDKFPTAQLESLFFWLLFISLQLFIKKRRVATAVLSYAVFRLTNEFFRGDDRGTLTPGSPLSPAQTVSLILIAVTLGYAIYMSVRRIPDEATVLPYKRVTGGVWFLKKPVVFIGVVLLTFSIPTAAFAARETTVVTATVENSRIHAGETTHVGFEVTATDPNNPNNTLTFTKESLLNPTFFTPGGSPEKVTYSSDNNAIATVDENGTVTGISPGTATITQNITISISSDASATPRAMDLINSNPGCKANAYGVFMTGYGCTFNEYLNGNYVRTVKIQVVPDDRLYLCQYGSEPEPVRLTMNTPSYDSDRVAVGGTTDVGYFITLTDVNDPSVTYTFSKRNLGGMVGWMFPTRYSSDNTSVATVNTSGTVTGVSEGEATIKVETISALHPYDDVMPFIKQGDGAILATAPSSTTKTLTLTRYVTFHVHSTPVAGDMVLAQGETGRVKTTFPTGYVNKGGDLWLVDDTSIAKIDKNGTVTGLRPGKTSVIHSFNLHNKEFPNMSDTILLTTSYVTVIPVMAVYPETVNVYTECSAALKVSFDSWYSGEKNGTWSVADRSIASIDQSGKVTGKKAGTTKATFTLGSGVATDCTVTVKEPPFKLVPKALTLDGSNTQQLSVVFDADYTGNRSGTWSVYDGGIASVEGYETPPVQINMKHAIPGVTGAKVTGLKSGTTTVTFTHHETGVTLSVPVTVKPGYSIVPNPITVYEGETGKLDAIFDDGYTGSKSGIWYVDDSNVASIDQNGIVTGKRAGTAVVSYLPDSEPSSGALTGDAGAGLRTGAGLGAGAGLDAGADLGASAGLSAGAGLGAGAVVAPGSSISGPAFKAVRHAIITVKPANYTVTFSGANPNPPPVAVKHDAAVPRPADPSGSGMVFLDWYTASDGGFQWDFTSCKVTEDMTLYAHWAVRVAPHAPPSPPLNIAPTIAGPGTINLTEGYAAKQETYTLSGTPAPTLSITANTTGATLSGNTLTIPAGLGVGSYSVTLEAANLAGTATKTVTVNVAAVTITLSPLTLPDALNGISYPVTTLTASGGTTPYTYSVSTGALPVGITLNSATGTISGTFSSTAGDCSFTVIATDGGGNVGSQDYVIHTYDIISIPPANIVWYGWNLDPAGRLSATGGAGGYTYGLNPPDVAALLAHGLTLNPDGTITGPPTDSGSVTVDVIVTDSHINTVTVSVTITFFDY